MRAGKLKKRGTIQRKTHADDGVDQNETWNDVTERWMSITAIAGDESVDAMALREYVTHKITMRYLSGLTAKDRIVSGGKTYQLVSVIDTTGENGRETICDAKEEISG